jgi:hypothetical protein
MKNLTESYRRMDTPEVMARPEPETQTETKIPVGLRMHKDLRDRVLAVARAKRSNIRIILEELVIRFLPVLEREVREHGTATGEKQVSSILRDEALTSVTRAEQAVLRERQSRQRKLSTASPSGRKSGPSRGASRDSKDKQPPPGTAQA